MITCTMDTSTSSELHVVANYTGRTPLDAETVTTPLKEDKANDDIDQTQNTSNEHPFRSTFSDDQDFPEGGYGWICVVCQLLIAVNTSGLNGVCVSVLFEAPGR